MKIHDKENKIKAKDDIMKESRNKIKELEEKLENTNTIQVGKEAETVHLSKEIKIQEIKINELEVDIEDLDLKVYGKQQDYENLMWSKEVNEEENEKEIEKLEDELNKKAKIIEDLKIKVKLIE